ncbi:MAG: hypothetical protein SWY16_23780 [Cyanobacteriota bacterium]|nr:hypothetical protein [Cyanobacteriota bacterium]
MQRVPMSPEAIELLSKMTGSRFERESIARSDLFLACSIWVMLGTLFVDGTIENRETQQLQLVLDRLIETDLDLRQFSRAVLQGIRQHKIYQRPEKLPILGAYLSVGEKLLLLGFGCQMSGIDGKIHLKERQYLGTIASYLQVNYSYFAILEATFLGTQVSDDRALAEVYDLLDPTRFPSPDAVSVAAARYLREYLPPLDS